jgi:toluene monooxygenase system ferredoxin subunit
VAWKRLCAIGDLAEDGLRRFEVDGIAVVAGMVAGDCVAYPPHCPHMAEPLDISGVCEDGVVTCTKHLWQWDMRTGAEMGMAERKLLRYPTRRDGPDVWIEIEHELTYDRS